MNQSKNIRFSLVILIYLWTVTVIAKEVVIIGTGYVGLVAGAGLASLGHHATCVDIDVLKITALTDGHMPIYEAGLQELIVDMVKQNRLTFSTNMRTAICQAEIVMIAVGTPMSADGTADLTALMDVASMLAECVKDYTIICIKSTVPVGTNTFIKNILDSSIFGKFDLVFNPEFLREGSALQDFFNNNPIVLGTDSLQAANSMKELYKPMLDKGTALIVTTVTAAETIKYAWNAYSAIKIAYVNQLSHFCNAVNADIGSVVHGMSFSDKLLPMDVIRPGPGIGGSCLPKDTQAFVKMAKTFGLTMSIVQTAMESNSKHTYKIIDELYNLLGTVKKGLSVAVLGFSFKPNTDDIRRSPALIVFKKLLEDGITVRAYDPQATAHMKKYFPTISYFDSAYEAIQETDAVILLTDWNECKQVRPEYMANVVKQRIVVDARNMWDPEELRRYGFSYYNLGRI